MDLVAIDWEHGMAPADEPGPDDLLGRVDWKSARIDEKGLFVERVLNRRNRYVQFLEELIDAGLIGNSSEAVVSGVEYGDDGEIKAWPIKRDTLTVTPMDWRTLPTNAMTALKGLSEHLPALKSLIPADMAGQSSGAESGESPEASPSEAGRSPAERDADEARAKRLSLELTLLELG
jgi:hypothetical protein